MKLNEITMPCRRLITVRSPMKGYVESDFQGALVRFYPGADDSDADIEWAKTTLQSCGAVAVRIMPRHRSIAAPKASLPTKHVTARTAVDFVLADYTSADEVALDKMCDEIMAEVGI